MSTRASGRVYRLLLRAYPREFRDEYGDEMASVFRLRLRENPFLAWWGALSDALVGATFEHAAILQRDVSYASRTLVRSKGWTAVAVLSLGLGIGANAALFSVVESNLLAKLPVDRPDELVTLGWRGNNPAATDRSFWGYWAEAADRGEGSFSYAAFGQLRDVTRTLDGLLAFTPLFGQRVTTGDTTERADVQLVSGDYYQVLGIPAELGRTILPEDEASAAPVAVISAEFWRQRFGEDPTVIGSSVRINGRAIAIIGVVPAGLGNMLRPGARSFDIAIPLTAEPFLTGSDSYLLDPSTWSLLVMGRLAPGRTLPQVEAELAPVFHAVTGTPEPPGADVEAARFSVRPGKRGISDARPEEIRAFALFAVVFGIVLVIACVNLATLLLFRGEARQREVAVQLAIGASRRRLTRQVLTESLVVGMLGGVTGLLLALGGLGLVRRVELADFRFDAGSFALAMALSLAASLLAGLTPAIRTTRLGELGLRAENVPEVGRSWLGKSLVAAQVALSFVLLVSAGLFARTLVNLQNIPVGFNPENLAFFSLDLSDRPISRDEITVLYEQILERIRSIPGIRSATLANQPLLAEYNITNGIRLDDGTSVAVSALTVHPGYFETMQIPVRSGRTFTLDDYETGALVVAVNEAFARLFFADANPVGQALPFGNPLSDDPLPIVGVVADATYSNLRQSAHPIWYVPHRRSEGRQATFFHVRSTGEPASVIPAIREAVREIDPALPEISVRTQEAEIERQYRSEWIFATVSMGFAGLALTVTMVGLFGLLSYSVARRTREIGIRMALGADRGRVLRAVVGQSLRVAGIGAAIGLAAALATTRRLESMLFGLVPNDPATLGAVVIVMLVVAVVAASIPARAASRVNPLVAIRHE